MSGHAIGYLPGFLNVLASLEPTLGVKGKKIGHKFVFFFLEWSNSGRNLVGCLGVGWGVGGYYGFYYENF